MKMEQQHGDGKQKPDNDDNFSRLLKHIESDASMLEKVEEKPKIVESRIEPVDVLVKPSAIKGKNFIHQNNQPDTPKLPNMPNYAEKTNNNPQYPNNQNYPNTRPGILKRSNSELSL